MGKEEMQGPKNRIIYPGRSFSVMRFDLEVLMSFQQPVTEKNCLKKRLEAYE